MTSTFLTNPIFCDEGLARCCDNAALIDAMVTVEVALAQVQADAGLVPNDAATEIAEIALSADVTALQEGVRRTGVPIPALIASLRAQVSTASADWLHYGATSQDILDSALCLCFRDALDLIGVRLGKIIDALRALSDDHSETPMVARTRGQLATPITFGLRAANWAQPLIKAENDLPRLRERALKVQLGGASGSLNTMGGSGQAIANALADRLSLSRGAPWHTDRSGFHDLGSYLGRLNAALGKIGSDVMVSARNEIGELQIAQGGESSTMPHKANPVAAEALEAVVSLNLGLQTALSVSAVHREERDGVHWPLEWMLLPQLLELTGAALRHAKAILDGLVVDKDAMRARLEASPMVWAEAVVFALADRIGRVEAERQVKMALEDGASLRTLLADFRVDDATLSDKGFMRPAQDMARRILATRLLG